MADCVYHVVGDDGKPARHRSKDWAPILIPTGKSAAHTHSMSFHQLQSTGSQTWIGEHQRFRNIAEVSEDGLLVRMKDGEEEPSAISWYLCTTDGGRGEAATRDGIAFMLSSIPW